MSAKCLRHFSRQCSFCYTSAMLKVNKIPHILFVVGVILVGFYGLILCILAVFIQIFFILNYWKNNPAQKQTKNFIAGCAALILALIFFVIGVYQYDSYFGGFVMIEWLIIGSVPLAISCLILLTMPTTSKNHE